METVSRRETERGRLEVMRGRDEDRRRQRKVEELCERPIWRIGNR